MRREQFVIGEFYHIFNRGTDKREIFSDKYDVDRFIQSLKMFNTVDPIGSIFLTLRRNSSGRTTTIQEEKRKWKKREKLVNIVCYCLNPNHFHLILEETVNGGISEFMKRLGCGYTRYYNEKHERSGVLFQGPFKAVYIESNKQLLHAGAYVNLNNRVHKRFERNKAKNFMNEISDRSSWREYVGENKGLGFCKKDIILGQFKNKQEYKIFAENTIKAIKEMRYEN